MKAETARNKIVLTLYFVLALSIGSMSTKAEAFAYCIQETAFTTLYKVDYTPATGAINGGAYYPTATTWYGGVTGTVANGNVYLAIAYSGTTTGVRFYTINLSSLTGSTWGVNTTTNTGNFYDQPRAATMVYCVPDALGDLIGESGAPKE